jgi:predicted aspartyl protease
MAAVIDTGFDGALTLPLVATTTLGLQWCRRGRALLADGTESLCDVSEELARWEGLHAVLPWTLRTLTRSLICACSAAMS